MRLTRKTNLAMRALMHCAVNDGRLVRKTDIARDCNSSENHMAQVIHALGQLGVLKTARGRHGGVMLARPPDQILVGPIFRQLESGVPFIECFSAQENTCPIMEICSLRDILGGALEAFYATLDKVSLADLVRDNRPLHAALALP